MRLSLLDRLACAVRKGVPRVYDPALHYNCVVEAVPQEDRQAVFQEFRRRRMIRGAHMLTDGRLQLYVRSAGELQAINSVVRDKVFAAQLSVARLVELAVSDPGMEVRVDLKTQNPRVGHVERVLLSHIKLPSESAFRRGVALHEQGAYDRAVECYDEAISIEAQDVRAWYNKILALAAQGKHREALDAADQVLALHGNVGLLWEAKSWVLSVLGRTVEADECLSKACELNPEIARSREAAARLGSEKRLQTLIEECRKLGKSPDTDIDFWWAKFASATESGDVSAAYVSLLRAAAIAPRHVVMHDQSGVALLPPGHLLLDPALRPTGAQCETLSAFAERITADGGHH